MEFHPGLCQVFNMTNKRNIIKHAYNIHDKTLQCIDLAKYLDINIHKSQNWTTQIEKANPKLDNANREGK